MKYSIFMLSICLALAACATERQTNAAVTGGAVGAAAGALLGDEPVEGALVGGALGAATGAILSDPRGGYYYRDGRREHDEGYHRGEREDRHRYRDDHRYRHYYRHDREEGDD